MGQHSNDNVKCNLLLVSYLIRILSCFGAKQIELTINLTDDSMNALLSLQIVFCLPHKRLNSDGKCTREKNVL